MDEFLDSELTEYESKILIKITKNLMKQKQTIPSTDDIIHELIRLSEITMRHFPEDINQIN